MKSAEYLILEEMLKSANQESDRGCALILAANLENRLGILLKAFLVDLSLEMENKLFNGTGSLATFSSRIDMCFSLGLIGFNENQDLNLVRKIRNEFAHSESKLTFKSPDIKNRCDAFVLKREMNADYPELAHHSTNSRDAFQIVVFSLCLMILSSKDTISTQKRITPASIPILPKRA